MPRRRDFKYGEFPVFQYQTFDRDSCTFTDRPIIPPERILFTDRSADDLYKSDEPEPELEIIELDPPADDAGDEPSVDDGPRDDGMST
jgi:hypothetical protein